MNIDNFPNQILLEFWFNFNLVSIYSYQDNDSKRFKAKRYYLSKEIIDHYNFIIKRKNFYDQTVDSDIKQYEEIRKLAKRQGEDYTTGWLSDYYYIKNHYRLKAVVWADKKN